MVTVLDAEMRQRKVDLLVLDGLVTATGCLGVASGAEAVSSVRVQAMSALAGCTTLLLNSVGSRSS